MKKIRILCSVLAVLMILPSMLLLASCGKKSSLTADTEISSLDLNHSQLTLYIGDTIKLVPIVKGLDNPSLIFTSSHPSIASVENTGTVTALSEGETMIVCQTEDQVLTATCNITVKAKDDSGTNDPVTPSLTLDTTALTLNPGNTHTLTVTLILPETVDQTITFTSSDSSVATVDKNGTITAIAPGVASIMATASNDLQAICLVTVGNDGAQRVNLDFTSATLVVDSTKQLNATYFTTIPGDSKTLTYSSSLPSVASIDNNGLITAKSPGTAVITVSNFNGTTNAICTITVIEKPTAHLTLDFTGITLSIGMSHTLNPTYIPINDSDSKVLSFTSSLPSVASIDQNGTITAKAAGTLCLRRVVHGDAEGQKDALRKGLAAAHAERFAFGVCVYDFDKDMSFIFSVEVIGVDHAGGIVELNAILEALAGSRMDHQHPAFVDARTHAGGDFDKFARCEREIQRGIKIIARRPAGCAAGQDEFIVGAGRREFPIGLEARAAHLHKFCNAVHVAAPWFFVYYSTDRDSGQWQGGKK